MVNAKVKNIITKLHGAYRRGWKLRIAITETDMPTLVEKLTDAELSLVCQELGIAATRDLEQIVGALCNKFHS